MTTIKVTEKYGIITDIKLEGHADYAPSGQDIVCAALSTLVEVLKNVSYSDVIIDGYYSGCFDQNKPEHQFLVRTVVKVLKELAGDYPKNVRLLYA